MQRPKRTLPSLAVVWSIAVVSDTMKAASCKTVAPPAKRFLVLSMPRSGSTWFVKFSELGTAPATVTWGEALYEAVHNAELDTKDKYMAYLDGQFERLEQGIGWRGDVQVAVGDIRRAASYAVPRVVGFKIMYDQLPKVGRPVAEGPRNSAMAYVSMDAVLEYAVKHDVLLIHLERENHLERYVSDRAVRHGLMKYHDNKGMPTALSQERNATFDVDVADAEGFVRNAMRDAALFRDYLTERCPPSRCLNLWYEKDLLGRNRIATFRDLASRLGLDTTGHRNMSFAKSRVPLRAHIANSDEVARSPLLGAWLDR